MQGVFHKTKYVLHTYYKVSKSLENSLHIYGEVFTKKKT